MTRRTNGFTEFFTILNESILFTREFQNKQFTYKEWKKTSWHYVF